MYIRFATEQDYDALNHLYDQVDKMHLQAHPERFVEAECRGRSDDYYKSRIDGENEYILVAEKAGKVVGFAEAYIRQASQYPVLRPRKWLLIEGIAVDSNYRDGGVGQLLFDELKRIAKLRALDQIELNVYSFNASAIRFYEKNGFRGVCQTMSLDV